MDYRSIFRFLSQIGMVLGLFFLGDLAVAWIYGEPNGPIAVFSIGFLLFNLLIFLGLRSHPMRLGIRESILSVNLLWLLLGVAGGIPLLLYTDISPASAFFEAVSGFTTTGATVYGDIESLSHLVLFHRSLMHWIGGMGIIVLGVGLLSMINPTGSLSLFRAESTGIQIEKLRPRIRETALSLWGIYLALTVADALLLRWAGMGWFDALNHAFSTLSTGGFSTKNASMGYWSGNGAVLWITTVFMLLSGINFLAHLRFLNRDISGYRSEEVRWYLALFALLAVALTLTHENLAYDTLGHSATHSFFTVASVMTTTGFASTDYGGWSHAAVALVFLAMFLGGNAGSTAGGVKVIRHVVVFKTLFAELKRILHPHAAISVFVDGRKIRDTVIAATFGFLLLFIFTNILMALYIYARGYDEMTAVSGALAVVGNIGPGFARVGPAENFAFFSDIDKIVLSVGMIIGRLECYTVYLLLSASFWKRF